MTRPANSSPDEASSDFHIPAIVCLLSVFLRSPFLRSPLRLSVLGSRLADSSASFPFTLLSWIEPPGSLRRSAGPPPFLLEPFRLLSLRSSLADSSALPLFTSSPRHLDGATWRIVASDDRYTGTATSAASSGDCFITAKNASTQVGSKCLPDSFSTKAIASGMGIPVR